MKQILGSVTLISIVSLMQPAGAIAANEKPVVIRGMNSDLALTRKQIKQLAQQATNGDNDAAVRLAMHSDFVQNDYGAAYFWFKKAALNGHVRSQFNLGVRSLGMHTLTSCEEARSWFEMARDNGDLKAQAELDRIPDCSKVSEKTCFGSACGGG